MEVSTVEGDKTGGHHNARAIHQQPRPAHRINLSASPPLRDSRLGVLGCLTWLSGFVYFGLLSLVSTRFLEARSSDGRSGWPLTNAGLSLTKSPRTSG